VLPRFDSPDEFEAGVRHAVAFLTAGSVYSHTPYEKVEAVRDANRRLGLGLIGVHEFLIRHGVKYGTDDAFEVLEPYMRAYARALEFAHEFQDEVGLSLSKGATAIAPNGTIGIIAESTPSADPMFSAAEQRNVKLANVHGPDRYEAHIVVDPVAKRLIKDGVDPSLIEDAYTLSLAPERRLAQQAFLQDYTDHAISSTVNLPHVVTDDRELHDLGNELMKHLPRLRGITFYPEGARAGQPRNPVDLTWALENEGTRFEGNEETCVGGVCGV
jgi:ribonucleoside-diphosphate reductase alpha chain